MSRNFSFIAFLMLSAFSMGVGVLGIMLKSPKEHSDIYLAWADEYQTQMTTNNMTPENAHHLLNHTQEMVYTALRYTPYEGAIWQRLSIIFHQSHEFDRAKRAGNIAAALGVPGAPGAPPQTQIKTLSFLQPARSLALSNVTDKKIKLR